MSDDDLTPPLEDPSYVPQHPPVDGIVPDVVSKWGPVSQLRWFDRFRSQLKPQPPSVWARYYSNSESHRGPCCASCDENYYLGYRDLDGVCCCRALKADSASPVTTTEEGGDADQR